MKTPAAVLFLLLPFLLFFLSAAQAQQLRPVKLIFDTDVGNDIDDALAFAVIHKLADRGEVELLAVTITKDNPWCAPYVNLINTFYGRPEIPIGMVRGGKTPNDGKYARAVAEKSSGGKLVYPRKINNGKRNTPVFNRDVRTSNSCQRNFGTISLGAT